MVVVEWKMVGAAWRVGKLVVLLDSHPEPGIPFLILLLWVERVASWVVVLLGLLAWMDCLLSFKNSWLSIWGHCRSMRESF